VINLKQDDQDHLTLSQAAKLSPGHPSTSAVWRWARKGVLSRSGQRIRLTHIRVGGKIFTTRDALDKFFAALAESDVEHFDRCVDESHMAKPTALRNQRVTDSCRQRSIAHAEAILDQAGI